jgi:hypothetical protein
LIGAANINSNGSFLGNSQGFSVSAKLATGQYFVDLISPPVDLNQVLVQITLFGTGGGQVSWLVSVPGTVVIFTFNQAGVPTDQTFSILVFDLTTAEGSGGGVNA